MKLLISDLDLMDSGNSVLLTLSNDQEVIVGNKVVNKLLRKFRLNSGSLAMGCAQRAFILDTTSEGVLVAHTVDDMYNDKDGNPAGQYTSEGFHIEFPSGNVNRMPVIRMAEVSRDIAEFINSLAGKYEPVGADEVSAPVQHIPTTVTGED